ncbi:hypothetical protein GQ457_13G006270 [Hibiscus cannabinus]
MFTDAQPSEWRCKSLENASISSSWCMNNTGSGSKAQPSHVCGLAAGNWEWVGGNTTSTVAEWNLICDHKFLAAIPTSLFFIGTILGCVFYGRLADVRLGRKKKQVVGRKWRGQVGQLGFFFFTAGFLSLSLINHLTRGHWSPIYIRVTSLANCSRAKQQSVASITKANEGKGN